MLRKTRSIQENFVLKANGRLKIRKGKRCMPLHRTNIRGGKSINLLVFMGYEWQSSCKSSWKFHFWHPNSKIKLSERMASTSH